MGNRPQILTSLGVSLAAHAVILVVLMSFDIFASPSLPSQAEAPLTKLIPVKKVDLPPATPEPEKIAAVSSSQPEKPSGAERLMTVVDRKELQVSEKFTSTPKEKIAKLEPIAVSSELIKFDGREVRAFVSQTNPKPVPPTPLVSNLPVEDASPSAPTSSTEGAVVEEEFLEKMPGFTPEPTMGLVDATVTASAGTGVSEITRNTDFQDLKDMLSFVLFTYQDPRDNQKYFKLSLRVNEKTQNFKAIPKEVFFLVDASISIKEDRLSQFKSGILECLNHLNPEDFFNVGIFKEQITLFNPASVPATSQNIGKVNAYMEWIKAGEKTDAFAALKQMIGTLSRSPNYIIFLSDGWPTQGVTDSRQLINEISAANAGKTAIFAYSGGAVNRYLLDFIAYKNRGWSEYSEREQMIGKNLAAMYGKIKDPILLNLRYRVSGVSDENVFPKMLPDFFRNAEFTIYGLYNNEQELVLQLLGDAGGTTREFLAQVPMSSAVTGEKDIARLWAFNKVYYLISQLEYQKDNTPILQEIEDLSKKFGIKTPYSNELKK